MGGHYQFTISPQNPAGEFVYVEDAPAPVAVTPPAPVYSVPSIDYGEDDNNDYSPPLEVAIPAVNALQAAVNATAASRAPAAVAPAVVTPPPPTIYFPPVPVATAAVPVQGVPPAVIATAAAALAPALAPIAAAVELVSYIPPTVTSAYSAPMPDEEIYAPTVTATIQNAPTMPADLSKYVNLVTVPTSTPGVTRTDLQIAPDAPAWINQAVAQANNVNAILGGIGGLDPQNLLAAIQRAVPEDAPITSSTPITIAVGANAGVYTDDGDGNLSQISGPLAGRTVSSAVVVTPQATPSVPPPQVLLQTVARNDPALSPVDPLQAAVDAQVAARKAVSTPGLGPTAGAPAITTPLRVYALNQLSNPAATPVAKANGMGIGPPPPTVTSLQGLIDYVLGLKFLTL